MGGVRCLSSLVILRKILCLVNVELTGTDTPVAANEVFDIVAGTGTGGLVALMFVKLGMSVDECIAEFRRLVGGVLQKSSGFGWRVGRGLGDVLMGEVGALVEGKGFERNLEQLNVLCEGICREDGGRARIEEPVVLCCDVCHTRTEENSHLGCGVCEATNAAPKYFPVKLFDKVLVSGESGNTRNPSRAVFEHLQDCVRLTKRHPTGVMIVNIGTGTMGDDNSDIETKQNRPFWSYLCPKLWKKRQLSAMATNCESMAKVMHQLDDSDPLLQYFRFSEDKEMHGVALDDWKAVEDGSIVKATEEYLKKPEVLAELILTAWALAMNSRASHEAQLERSMGHGGSEEGDDMKVELRLRKIVGFDDFEKPVVPGAEFYRAAVAAKHGDVVAEKRGRQSKTPGELFHGARVDLRKAFAEGK